MKRSRDNQTPLDLAIKLWENRDRRSEHPGWHGIGVYGEQIFLYVEHGEDSTALQRASSNFEPEVMTFPRFHFCASLANAPSPAQPGDGVSAIDTSNFESNGTIGALMRFKDVDPKDSPLFLLSAFHVLARDPRFRDGLKVSLDPSKAMVSSKVLPVELDEDNVNLVDAAVARLDPGVSVQPKFNGINLTIPAPADPRPDPGSRVAKLGAGTGLTVGNLRLYCPRIEVTPDHQIGPIDFQDQMLIESNSTDTAFMLPGDSGAVVVCDQRPAGLVVAMTPEGVAGGKNVPGGHFGLASPFLAVLSELKRVLKHPVEIFLPGVAGVSFGEVKKGHKKKGQIKKGHKKPKAGPHIVVP